MGGPLDVRVVWRAESFGGDIVLGSDGALDTADPLATSVVVSLFTWRRANADDLVDGDRNGWWGDTLAADNDRIGSRLWLLFRRKMTPAVIALAREYALEALQWLIADGVATRVEVETERQNLYMLALIATIYKNDGQARTLRFDLAWNR